MYHSVHDNFYYEANLTDPTFSYHTTVGLVWGKVALMLATSPVLPYDPRHYSTALSNILSGLKEKYETVLTKHNISLGKYSYTHSLSPSLLYIMLMLVCLCSLDYVQSSIKEFTTSANKLWEELQKASDDPSDLNHLRMINYQLMQLERSFIIPQGLPGRPYFR